MSMMGVSTDIPNQPTISYIYYCFFFSEKEIQDNISDLCFFKELSKNSVKMNSKCFLSTIVG